MTYKEPDTVIKEHPKGWLNVKDQDLSHVYTQVTHEASSVPCLVVISHLSLSGYLSLWLVVEHEVHLKVTHQGETPNPGRPMTE